MKKRNALAFAVAKRLGILEAERKAAMPKMTTVEINQVKAGKDRDEIRIGAMASYSRRGHNIIRAGKLFVCTGCKVRRKLRTCGHWATVDCIARQESADAWRDEVLRDRGLRVEDPAEKKILVRPLEAGPLVVDLTPSVKLGPTQEVTDYAVVFFVL